MKKKNIFICINLLPIMLLLLYFSGCKKDTYLEAKEIKITDLSVEPYETSALFKGKVDYPGEKTVTIELCLTAEMDSVWSVWSNEMIEENEVFVVNVNDLSRHTEYYWRVKVKNSYSVKLSETMWFATLGLPTLGTLEVTDITFNSAVGHCVVMDEGEAEVTERGVCWGRSHNPTINENHTNSGMGTGNYTIQMNILSSGTTYYVRAYATNIQGTSYSNEVSFVTAYGPGGQGAINGVFSVSSSKKVFFSKGNLQYHASSHSWRFAENQWDYVGNDNSGISWNYNGWIDLFGWGTSGYNHGAVCYQPWSTSNNYPDYYVYGNGSYNLYDMTGQADWGYNAISDGGNEENSGWRTLTCPEWYYLFNTRSTSSDIRYAKASVNGVNGIILLPDDWTSTIYTLNCTNTIDANFIVNTIIAEEWKNVLEANGAVFFPAAGYRSGTSIGNLNSFGYYWSSTTPAWNCACTLYFSSGNLDTGYINNDRCKGQSVRLVRNC